MDKTIKFMNTKEVAQALSCSLPTATTGDGFSAVSFLLPFYAKMLKNGLNTEVLSTVTIKLRKLDVKKLTRHKLSNKQSFKLSTILDRKITRNPENYFYLRL